MYLFAFEKFDAKWWKKVAFQFLKKLEFTAAQTDERRDIHRLQGKIQNPYFSLNYTFNSAISKITRFAYD